MGFFRKLVSSFMNSCPSISAEALHGSIDKYYVIDVRELWEHKGGTIEPSLKIPMGDIPQKLNEIPTDKPLVIVCRSGGRSGQITHYLVSHGFTAYNLVGGMLAWEA